MITLLAFTLITVEPAQLLGGQEDVREQQPQGVIVYEEQAYRAEGSYERYRHERSRFGGYADALTAAPRRPVQAGDPVQLDEAFFQGPLTGGVGGEPPRLIVVRHSGHPYYRWR
ncbi:hypothetical protein OA2633_10844 [Oceanicaulis alexandrii HTCC2633]|jgi:hypothetical protein|uniref:hypothetical protein n=1 Tax=Oceanicaulis sp. HTCC2633 TaxID=314254 RepID=UPI000066D301|nr:hypothetical protein [Oceanicaulis sp. HTCC2633]EAP88744.1 hypothetical protein OA2633_10844 [Oceanicaulis alexandrii HTCC2633] [Oceanicaulis sp. HTCC2633]